MSEEYNSKLISRLYNSNDKDEVLEILEEMDEIKDSHFLYPIYDKYKKSITEPHSHYFVNSIGKIKGEESINILRQIAQNPDTHLADFMYSLDTLGSVGIFDEEIVNRVSELITDPEYIKDNEYSFQYLLSYARKADIISKSEDMLRNYFFDNQFNNNIKKIILKYLLKQDSKKYLQYFFENYDNLKSNEKTEIVFAKEISGWKNGIIEKIKDKILKDGSKRAKEIIESGLEIENLDIEKKEKEMAISYMNAPIVEEIYDLRNKINLKSNAKFGHDIFSQSELLSKQTKSVKDKAELIGFCIDLREFIQLVNHECVSDGVQLEEAKKLLGNISESDLNKSLFRLAIFLNKNNININNEIFGLRTLYQILNKIGGHPGKNEDIVRELTKINMVKDYSEEKWDKIHGRLLNHYRDSLLDMNKSMVLEEN